MERLLQRVELIAFRQSLDRRELAAVRLRGQQGARLHRLSVQEHRAGAAAGRVASDVGAGEPEGLAEEVHEERAGLDLGLTHRPVDGDGDGRHGGLLLQSCCLGGRPSSRSVDPRPTAVESRRRSRKRLARRRRAEGGGARTVRCEAARDVAPRPWHGSNGTGRPGLVPPLPRCRTSRRPRRSPASSRARPRRCTPVRARSALRAPRRGSSDAPRTRASPHRARSRWIPRLRHPSRGRSGRRSGRPRLLSALLRGSAREKLCRSLATTQFAKSPTPSTTSVAKTASLTIVGSNRRRSGTVVRNAKESSISALSAAPGLWLRTRARGYQDTAEAAMAAFPVQGVPLP